MHSAYFWFMKRIKTFFWQLYTSVLNTCYATDTSATKISEKSQDAEEKPISSIYQFPPIPVPKISEFTVVMKTGTHFEYNPKPQE